MWPLLSVDFSWHINISTHTSRVGCDTTATPVEVSTMYFYSHIPCGMWQIAEAVNDEPVNFYSHIPCGMWLWRRLDHTRGFWEFLLTHPVWDVTNQLWGTLKRLRISTHTSRVGCDDKPIGLNRSIKNFYSHIPCGMWPAVRYFRSQLIAISTHTSRVGCDYVKQFCNLVTYISTHTSRVGCDHYKPEWF